MTRKPFIRYITALVLLFSCTHIVYAQLNKAYDAETPLVIACNWDMAPYEFNNEGEPDGYNIQLLGTILDKLQIQYKVLMTEGEEAMAAFERHEADIIIDPGYRYHRRPYGLSHSIIDYYRVKVATHKNVQPLVALLSRATCSHRPTSISRPKPLWQTSAKERRNTSFGVKHS